MAGFVLDGAYTGAAALTTLVPLNGTVFNPENMGLFTYPTLLTGLVTIGCGTLIIVNIGLRCASGNSASVEEEKKLISQSPPETPCNSGTYYHYLSTPETSAIKLEPTEHKYVHPEKVDDKELKKEEEEIEDENVKLDSNSDSDSEPDTDYQLPIRKKVSSNFEAQGTPSKLSETSGNSKKGTLKKFTITNSNNG
jgi:hypothetical protein